MQDSVLNRKYLSIVQEKLNNFPVVALIGPRQIGKTTLAKEIALHKKAIYLDLENYRDLAKLENPLEYFEMNNDRLIILDEIQNKPDLFMTLRGVVDQNRQQGRKFGQFLILGSASIELLRQSSESLAGRIIYVEMTPISVVEVPKTNKELYRLWVRGGFPESFIASSDAVSMEWRQTFIKTYLERDIPSFAPKIPAATLRRLWTMLAHLQTSPLNASKLAGNIGVNGQTVSRYVDLLTDLFLVRSLQPFYENIGKRLVKSPKIYVRDSGILHALLNINNFDDLLSHSVVGASWEGFVIDNLLSFLPINAESYFYRTSRGAEIDLVLKLPDNRILAIEIKNSSVPSLERGFYEACEDIKPTHRFVVYNGEEKFPLKKEIYAIGLREMMDEIADGTSKNSFWRGDL